MFEGSLTKKRLFFASIKQTSTRSVFAMVTIAALAACGGGGGAGSSTIPSVATSSSRAGVVAMTASATPTPVPLMNVPAHIPTWVYDEYWAGGANASASAVTQYVTYAEGGNGNTKAQKDCSTSPKSCYSVFYFDPNFQYDGTTCPVLPDTNFINAASESSFVHEAGYTDAAHRVVGHYNEGCKGSTMTIPVYLANQTSPSVIAWFQNYLQQNGDSWDNYFMDDTSTVLLDQTYGPGGGFCQDSLPNHWCSTTQEYPTDSAVAQAHAAFANSLNHLNGSPMKFFFNGIDFSGQTPRSLQLLTLAPGHFSGAVCENCIVSGGTLRPNLYAPVLKAMAQIDAIPNEAIVELNTGASPAGSAAQLTQRTVATAIAWLGYSDGHTIVFPDFETNTQGLSVWPEDLIYPGAPLQTMSTGASDLAVATGVYRREFVSCFNNQAPIGPCAAVVNASSATVTVSSAWLQQTYGHVISMTGGDILSGGTLSLTATAFSPNVTTIAPGQAVLLAQ